MVYLVVLFAFLFYRAEGVTESEACRYLTNHLEELPHRIRTVKFSNISDKFSFTTTCPNTINTSWCVLLNDARCCCNGCTGFGLNLYSYDMAFSWNISMLDYFLYDGTVVGCFENERLIQATYASGYEIKNGDMSEQRRMVTIYSVVFGLLSTALFITPCFVLVIVSSKKQSAQKGRRNTMAESVAPTTRRGSSRSSYRPSIPSVSDAGDTNFKWKDVKQIKLIAKSRICGVWKAEVKGVCHNNPNRNLVCLKILNDDKEQAEATRFAFLQTFETKRSLAAHANLINYLGCSFRNGKNAPLALVVELGLYGTLYDFLQAKRRAKIVDSNHQWKLIAELEKEKDSIAHHDNVGYYVSNVHEDYQHPFTVAMNTPFTERDLTYFAIQIAKALDFLHELSVVHRSLTSECVYIGENFVLKVGGFHYEKISTPPRMQPKRLKPAMELQLREKTFKNRKLAQWSPPEVILNLDYSQGSDMWSFGMTLWEIASYGEPPFDGIPLKDLSERFYNDERPSCPENCSTRMHEIMKQCWKLQPIERPLFSQILREFGVDGPLGANINKRRPTVVSIDPTLDAVTEEGEENINSEDDECIMK